MVWSRPSCIEIGTSFAACFPAWWKEVPWEPQQPDSPQLAARLPRSVACVALPHPAQVEQSICPAAAHEKRSTTLARAVIIVE